MRDPLYVLQRVERLEKAGAPGQVIAQAVAGLDEDLRIHLNVYFYQYPGYREGVAQLRRERELFLAGLCVQCEAPVRLENIYGLCPNCMVRMDLDEELQDLLESIEPEVPVWAH